jgi:restriction endonuclease S subunit/type I restriction-modification system DNA methylase subunit
MPPYSCEKCGKVFLQKSGYVDHVNKKRDCSSNTIIESVIEKKVEQKVKEVIRATQQKPEITKESLPAFFEDLHNLLWNKAGLNPERALEHMIFFFAYRLIEQQADALSLPQECRWSYIASLKNENDLFESIKKGVSSFRSKPKTKPFFKPHEIHKADIVFEIIQQINRISLAILQETDTLGDIFEYMLGRGMSTMSDEGQYFTNRAICRLAFKLAYDIKKTLRRADGTLCTFADWFCGTGGFPAEYVKGVKANLPNVDWKKECGAVYCQDMNLSSVTTTLLNMLILTGIPFSGDKIRGSNSFSDAITTGAGAPFPGLTVDYCFMNPPYGGDKSKGKEYKFAYAKKIKAEDGTTSKKFFVNAEIQSIGIEDDEKVSAGVQLAMATLSADGGVCSIVLPQGFFFGASKKCVELRKKIAEDYKIWYVVDIASGSFINTGTKTSMMVFQRGVGPTEKVSFIGLDGKELMSATLAELRTKHYSLNYKQYLPQTAVEVEGFEMVKLGDIAEWQMGKRIVKDQVETGKYPVYGGGGITFYTNTSNRTDINCKISREGMSEANCVLMITGDYYQNSQGMTVVSKDTQKVLNSYLWNWLVVHKKVVYECGQGTAQKAINMVMLNDLDVPIPSLERQQQIVEAIDGWTNLAQNEETSLKMLEKQMMFQVKEMGRGQTRIKLETIAKDITFGFMIASGDYGTEGVPVIKTKNIKSKRVMYPVDDQKIKTKLDERFRVKRGDMLIVLGGSPGETGLWEFDEDAWLNQDCAKISIENPITNMFVFYSLQGQSFNEYIDSNTTKTTIGHISRGVVREIEVPLPPLTEQQKLQSDFDEIRHKHAKIAIYKAKAQDAIQRLIPGAT